MKWNSKRPSLSVMGETSAGVECATDLHQDERHLRLPSTIQRELVNSIPATPRTDRVTQTPLPGPATCSTVPPCGENACRGVFRSLPRFAASPPKIAAPFGHYTPAFGYPANTAGRQTESFNETTPREEFEFEGPTHSKHCKNCKEKSRWEKKRGEEEEEGKKNSKEVYGAEILYVPGFHPLATGSSPLDSSSLAPDPFYTTTAIAMYDRLSARNPGRRQYLPDANFLPASWNPACFLIPTYRYKA
ncbi:hypothetical protein DFP72DRAFT_840737 [Ephemerocybe angulata]|uniref:Uncharacterized protein n=1 Tax=Ephemerocybe angulata TaxID=980116 RepID=A0A8H6IDJ3_9AGAR|nr:hypothetical protein DFP72DRAFT_840737 [Tulosesus angulatus]